MPIGRAVKNQNDLRIVVKDGAALTEEWATFDGEIEISNLRRKGQAVEAYEARGKETSLRHTTRERITFTLTIQARNFAGASDCSDDEYDATPGEVFNRLGAWAGATSTLPVCKGGTDVFCVDLEAIIAGTDLGDPDDHKVTFKAVHGIVSFTSGSPDTWSIECTCYGGTSGDLAALG